MFGYIIVNKQELKFREFDVYQSYYCGLCQSLKERFGRRGQLTLSYDMTFVALLLSALYDEPVESSTCKCVAHPFEAHATSRSVFTDYAADMNLLLSYYKCLDDWTDERKWKCILYTSDAADEPRCRDLGVTHKRKKKDHKII